MDKWNLPLALMPYSLDGEEHFADMGAQQGILNLFKALASGVKATTSQLPVQSYLDYLGRI